MFDQLGNAVECDATVVADDASTPVSVRQSSEDVRTTTTSDIGSVRVKDSVVVRLAILRESFDDVWVRLVAVSLQRAKDQAKATVRHDGSLQWSLGLQTNDHFVVTIDVAGRVCGD